MAGIKVVQAESRTQMCPKEGIETEFRKYRRGQNKNGEPRWQWRCRSCLDKSDRRAKNRLKNDLQVFKGNAKPVTVIPSIDQDVIDGWNVWVNVTGRPDHDAPNSRFVDSYNRIRDEYTKEEMQEAISLAAYLPPADRDPLDVRRVTSILTWVGTEEQARKLKDSGARVIPTAISPELRHVG